MSRSIWHFRIAAKRGRPVMPERAASPGVRRGGDGKTRDGMPVLPVAGMRDGGARRSAAVWALTALALAALPAAGQVEGGEPSPEGVRGQEAGEVHTPVPGRMEELLERTRRAPGDLDALFELAGAAVAVEDYETAIGALERMLIFEPELPRVRLEVGVLYFRLGSYALARSYLLRAREGAPEEVRVRVLGYLEELERRVSRWRWGGGAQWGWRVQSNPAAVAERGTTFGFGEADFPLRTEEGPESDGSLALSGAAGGSYDWGTQWEDALEGRLGLYGNLYAERGELDLLVTNAGAGPRVDLGRFGREGFLHPYLAGSYVRYGGAELFWEGGGGVQWRWEGLAGLSGTTGYDYRLRRYNDTPELTVTDRDGYLHRGEQSVRLSLGERSELEGRLSLERYGARRAYRSFDDVYVRVGYAYRFRPLWDRRVTFRARFSWNRTGYDAPEETVETSRKRKDEEWRASGQGRVELAGGWYGFGRLEYVQRDSNVSIYGYDNWELTLGGGWDFR